MGRPDREPLHEKVEVDETHVGGSEGGRRGGRELLNKPRVGGAVEIRGTASGRVRLQVVPDASGPSRTGFVKVNVKPGRLVVTPMAGRVTSPWQRWDPAIARASRGIRNGPRRCCRGSSVFSGPPQHLAARDSPWGPTPPSPGLPGRGHLPLQPAPDSDGSLSHPARPRELAATHDRQPVVWGRVNRKA